LRAEAVVLVLPAAVLAVCVVPLRQQVAVELYLVQFHLQTTQSIRLWLGQVEQKRLLKQYRLAMA
jgi:hypothetical protein